jgi:hypothetical protein
MDKAELDRSAENIKRGLCEIVDQAKAGDVFAMHLLEQLADTVQDYNAFMAQMRSRMN